MSTQQLHPDTDPTEARQFEKARRWIVVSMLVGLSGFILAPILARGYFVNEFQRMGTAHTLALLTAEAVALFWFIRFLVLHGVLRLPLKSKRVEGSAKLVLIGLIASLMVSAAFDAGVSVYEARQQGERYKSAQRVQGTIVELTVTEDKYPPESKSVSFDIVAEYEFEGVTRELRVTTSEDPQRRAARIEMGETPIWDYQPGLLETLLEDEPPIPVNMRVNPDNPVEAWIEIGPIGVPMLELAALSAVCAFIQLLAAMATAVAVATEFRIRRSDLIPWWIQPASFIVIVFEGFILLVMSLVMGGSG